MTMEEDEEEASYPGGARGVAGSEDGETGGKDEGLATSFSIVTTRRL